VKLREISHFALTKSGILGDIIRASLNMAAFTAAEVTWSTGVGLGYMHYTQS